jgi:glycosyltransferase involved in cell wall biosynthesis
MDLIEAAPGQTVVTLHDYSSVCLRNHLVTREGLYCGLPGGRPCADCDCAEARPGLDRVARHGAFYRAADRLLAPSRDTATRIETLFGPLAITVAPHEEELPEPLPRRSLRPGHARRIGVLGAIGAHKGADVVHALARDARRRGLDLAFTIVGYSDIPEKMAAMGVVETGRYADSAEALVLLARHAVDLILIPSIWPETYCYTLSIALVSGLPVAVFDLGAPAERLRAIGTGHCLDPALANEPGRLNDVLLALDHPDISYRQASEGIRFASYPSLLRDYYSLETGAKSGRTPVAAAPASPGPTSLA